MGTTDSRGWRNGLSSLSDGAECCNIDKHCNNDGEIIFGDSVRGPNEISMLYERTYDFNTSVLSGYADQMEMMRDDKIIFDVRGPAGRHKPPGHYYARKPNDTGSHPLNRGGPISREAATDFIMPYWTRGPVKGRGNHWEAENISRVMPTNQELQSAHDGSPFADGPHGGCLPLEPCHVVADDYVTLAIDGNFDMD